jgi:hypothetical protein
MNNDPPLTRGQHLLRAYLDLTNRLNCGCVIAGCGCSAVLLPVVLTGGAIGVWLLV